MLNNVSDLSSNKVLKIAEMAIDNTELIDKGYIVHNLEWMIGSRALPCTYLILNCIY